MLWTDLFCRRIPRRRVHHLRNESPLIPRSRPGKANWPYGGSFPKVIEHFFFNILNKRLEPKAIQYSILNKNRKNFGMTKAICWFWSPIQGYQVHFPQVRSFRNHPATRLDLRPACEHRQWKGLRLHVVLATLPHCRHRHQHCLPHHSHDDTFNHKDANQVQVQLTFKK